MKPANLAVSACDANKCVEQYIKEGDLGAVYTDERRDEIAEWLQLSESEKNAYSSDEVDKQYNWLLTREFTKMAAKAAPKDGYRVELGAASMGAHERDRDMALSIFYNNKLPGAAVVASVSAGTPRFPRLG